MTDKHETRTEQCVDAEMKEGSPATGIRRFLGSLIRAVRGPRFEVIEIGDDWWVQDYRFLPQNTGPYASRDRALRFIAQTTPDNYRVQIYNEGNEGYTVKRVQEI